VSGCSRSSCSSRSDPLFPYFGWIILGWSLTIAAIEVGVFQRVLQTVSPTGNQWFVVIGLSWLAPLVVGVDRRRGRAAGRRFSSSDVSGMLEPRR
jgi:hypothetical protein